jgi:hypothetical protein
LQGLSVRRLSLRSGFETFAQQNAQFGGQRPVVLLGFVLDSSQEFGRDAGASERCLLDSHGIAPGNKKAASVGGGSD